MASKRDWNDMSDSDSDQDQQQQVQSPKQEPKDQLEPDHIPSLNKIVSSPLPQKRPPNEQQNLNKLENCPKQDIWLYAPLYYRDNIDDVDKILKAEQDFHKIEQFPKGWNVLTKRELAKSYIVEGKKEGKFFIKFYFSNKNDDNNTNTYQNRGDNHRNDYDNRKVKYIPKSSNSKGDYTNMRSPDSLRRIESHQEYVGGRTPKSPTYQSNSQWRKNEDDSRGYRQKNYNNPNNNNRDNRDNNYKKGDREDSSSLGKEKEKQKYNHNNNNSNYYNNNNSKGYKPRYSNKSGPGSKQDLEYVPESPTRRKYVQKKEEEPKHQESQDPVIQTSTAQTSKSQPVTVVQKQHQQVQQQQQIEQKAHNKSQQQGDQGEDNVEEIKSINNSPNEKKKNKNKKKNKLLKDDNNPFSLLNGI